MTRLYQLVMDSAKNPLSNIPDVNTRHMIMQVLAWMWCIVFSSWVGSIVVFGISALVHAILIAGIFITVDEEIDNEMDWFLSEQTWEEYFNEGYEDSDDK